MAKGGSIKLVRQVSDRPVQGDVAQSVYGVTSVPDGMQTEGGSAVPVRLIADSELLQNGGVFKVDGDPQPIIVMDAPTGSIVEGGSALPVYLRGGNLAGTYYVDATGGNDANSGLSPTYAWKTLAHINSVVLIAGDNIFFKRGESWVNGQLTITQDNILLGNYGIGALPALSGALLLNSAAYSWTVSAHGTNEYYLRTAAGGNPGISTPLKVHLDNVRIRTATIGALTDHTWNYGDNDGLGYNTVYIRDDTGDPDVSGAEVKGIWINNVVTGSGNGLIVDGLHLTEARYRGVYLAGTGNIVRNCDIDYCASGVGAYHGSNRIHHSHIHHGLMHTDDAAPNNDFGAIGVEYGGGTIEIDHNEFDHLLAPSLDYTTDGSCVEIFADYAMANASIHHNYCHDSGNFAECGSSTGLLCDGVNIYRNLFVNCKNILSIHNDPGETFYIDLRNVIYEHNTWVYWSAAATALVQAQSYTLTPPAGQLTVRHNAFYCGQVNNFMDAATPWTNVPHTYNLFWAMKPASIAWNVVLDATDRHVDPALLDVPTYDLHLRSDSGAVDTAGLVALPADLTDYEDTVVPLGAGPDVGAYEHDPSDVTVGVVASDNFDRADSITTMGNLVKGTSWVPEAGTWGISTNRAYSVSDTTYNNTWCDLGNQNGTMTCTINGELNNGGTNRVPGLCFRYIDSSNYLMVRMQAGNIYLRKKDGGANSDLVTHAHATANATDYVIAVVMSGNSIKVYVDGVLEIDHTLAGGDVKYNAAGNSGAGLLLTKTGSPSLTARWDDFSFSI